MRHLGLVHDLALDAAKAGVLTLLVLLVAEAVLPGSVARFFNLLWLVLWVFGCSLVVFAAHQERERRPPLPLGLGLLGLAVAVYAWLALAPYAAPRARAVAAVMTLLVIWFLTPLLKSENPES